MAKRKPKNEPPPIAPHSIEHLLLQRALADVTETDARTMLTFMVAPPERRSKTKAQTKADCTAIQRFTALGYAFWAWHNSPER